MNTLSPPISLDNWGLYLYTLMVCFMYYCKHGSVHASQTEHLLLKADFDNVELLHLRLQVYIMY